MESGSGTVVRFEPRERNHLAFCTGSVRSLKVRVQLGANRTIRVLGMCAPASKSADRRTQIESESNHAVRILTRLFEVRGVGKAMEFAATKCA